MSTGKTPKWESELWSYVSCGNSIHCPLIGECESKRNFLCSEEVWKHTQRLIDKEQFNINSVDFTKVQIEGEGPCRVLHLVERIAEKYVKMGGIDSPPVPTVLIGLFDRRYSVEVRLVPLTIYHGAIWKIDRSWVVQLNKNDTPDRQRLSLFHEAFHILAHRKCIPVFRKRGTKIGSFNELLADYFAGCILMPREWVKERWAEVKDLSKMAKIFDVPQSAMCIRLKRLGLI